MALIGLPLRSVLRSPLYSPLVGKWGGAFDPLSLFANGETGFLYDLSKTSRLFQLSGGTVAVTTDGDPIGWAQSLDPTQRISTQATTSARPFWKTPNFARFDGADDNLLTTFVPSTQCSIGLKFKPTSINKCPMGGRPAGVNANNMLLYVDGLGHLAAGVGTRATTDITGGGDIRGARGVGILTTDGTTDRLYWNGTQIASIASAGGVAAGSALRIGALNQGGSATLYSDSDIFYAIAINRALTPTETLNLANVWGTS